jgi:hypothetical protein
MSPIVDFMRRKIRYQCNLCSKVFDTKEEEIIHEVRDHYGYSPTMNFSSVL